MTPDVQEWHDKADSDWRMATREWAVVPADRPSYEGITFHAQQCVEKLIKGALVARGVVPPHSHDLTALAKILEAAEPTWAWPDRAELSHLTRGAVLFRYPFAAVTRSDARQAIDVATRLRASLLPLL